VVRKADDRRLLQVDLTVQGQAGASPVVLSFVRVVQ
jgi:general secretion pathway protein I